MKFPEHEAGEVSVKPLVPRNQLVVEVEDGHQASLLQPEDGNKVTREEDAHPQPTSRIRLRCWS